MASGLALAVGLVACGNPEDPEPIDPGPTGAACTAEAECEAPALCITEAPGGYCSRDCTPCPAGCADACPSGCIVAGEPLCPNGGRCVEVSVMTGLPTQIRCLAECTDAGDCRSGYTCQAVPGSSLQVCLP